MTVVVDSSVWIDFFNGRSTPEVGRLEGYLGSERLVVGDLMLCEVLRGFRHPHHVRLADEFLALCEPVVFGGHELARQAANYYRELRHLGATTRKTIDLLIGTWCIANRASLLHCDRDVLPLVRHFGLVEA